MEMPEKNGLRSSTLRGSYAISRALQGISRERLWRRSRWRSCGRLTRGTCQWVKGKSADTFGPIGRWLVTAEEVPDPQSLNLWLEVDGHRYQNGSTATMVFGVAHLVSYLSRFMSLQPGDIISTGTPPGVGHGRKPPVYLRPGNVMRLGIDGLGEQRQEAVAWS